MTLANMSLVCTLLTLILCVVSGDNVSVSDGKTLAQLNASRFQKDNLVNNMCWDLQTIFVYNLSDTCQETFWSPETLNSSRSNLKVRCRSKQNLQIQVNPTDNWQIAVPISADEADHNMIIDYKLISPNITFDTISLLNPSKSYIIYTTVLNKDGRPSHWWADTVVPAWNESAASLEHRNLDIKVNFSNITANDIVNGVFTWNQTGDNSSCFDFEITCEAGTHNTAIVMPDSQPSIVIENLPLNDTCQVEVKRLFEAGKLGFRTPPPTHLEGNKISRRYGKSSVIQKQDADIKPEGPDEIMLEATEESGSWRVWVGWPAPSSVQERYNVTLRADHIQTLSVAGNATEAVFTGVTGEGEYNVSVYTIKGGYMNHQFARAIFPERVRSDWGWAVAAGGAWGVTALVAIALGLYYLRFKRGVYTYHKPKLPGLDSKVIEEEECLEPLAVDDQWEVPSERLMLHEVIGEGAFGVVRRGMMAPATKEVAVKMLKEFPTLDEKRCFRLEMELMKSVGAHPHVVSLVGCCSGKRPAIVAEYCAEGDLLSFLRRSWDGMISKRNAKYYNNNVDTSDYRNDLFKTKCEIQGKLSAVVNKEYDLQGMCDLTFLDLLSFCRQIAMGMEFLAANRVVHRDLAARNVLVTRDKTLKIADFGLSRDVYEVNQYKQMGNEKMPVKWMALESLMRRIYTSQSDVWSFGVVVWEVLTVGGAPYPGVPAARLPRLLRIGYRMQRPANCTKQLYEMLLSCWDEQPRRRPTFPELHRRLDEMLNSACADQYLCLELDDEPPPQPPLPHRYFKLLLRGKKAWNRESYERPLKVHQGNYNHYTSPPASLK